MDLIIRLLLDLELGGPDLGYLGDGAGTVETGGVLLPLLLLPSLPPPVLLLLAVNNENDTN